METKNTGIDIYSTRRISLFNHAKNNAPECETSIGEILEQIREGKFKLQIEHLRTLTPELYKQQKEKLKCFTVAGTFPKVRNKSSFDSVSGLMVLDWDHVPNPKGFRDSLKKYDCIYCAFISPSGKGVKAIAVIKSCNDDAEFKQCFFSIKKILNDIDDSGKDISRLCFFSYDPELWINPDAVFAPFDPIEITEQIKVYSKPVQLKKHHALTTAERMIADAPDGEKHKELLKSSRLLGGYVAANEIDKDEAFDVLHNAISQKNIKSLPDAVKTIKDGLNHGEKQPIESLKYSTPPKSKPNLKSKIENHEGVKLFRLTKKTSMERPMQLFGKVWAQGEVAFLFGEDGSCKTICAVQIGCSLATGQQTPGFPNEVPPQVVVLFDAELSDYQFNTRYPEGLPENFKRMTFSEDGQGALIKADIHFVVNQIEQAANELQSKIIILDNLAALTSMIDCTKTSDSIQLMGLLNDLKKKGFSILIIDHCRKPQKENEFKTISKHDLQGSKMKTNLVDSVFSIGKSCQGENYRYIKALKIRSYEMVYTKTAVATMYLKTDPLRLDFVGLDPEWSHVNDRSSQVNKMSNDGKSQADIAREIGITQQMVSKYING